MFSVLLPTLPFQAMCCWYFLMFSSSSKNSEGERKDEEFFLLLQSAKQNSGSDAEFPQSTCGPNLKCVLVKTDLNIYTNLTKKKSVQHRRLFSETKFVPPKSKKKRPEGNFLNLLLKEKLFIINGLMRLLEFQLVFLKRSNLLAGWTRQARHGSVSAFFAEIHFKKWINNKLLPLKIDTHPEIRVWLQLSAFFFFKNVLQSAYYTAISASDKA